MQTVDEPDAGHSRLKARQAMRSSSKLNVNW